MHQAIEMNRKAYLAALGRRIRARRLAMGNLSQRRLATICAVRQGTISKLERGELEPSFRLLWSLAGALGMSLAELAEYPPVVPPFPESPTPEAVAG